MEGLNVVRLSGKDLQVEQLDLDSLMLIGGFDIVWNLMVNLHGNYVLVLHL
jgi:hypothetical protein